MRSCLWAVVRDARYLRINGREMRVTLELSEDSKRMRAQAGGPAPAPAPPAERGDAAAPPPAPGHAPFTLTAVGYGGVMLPVCEDPALASAYGRGSLGVTSLLACASVCGVGLDCVPIAGDASEAGLCAVLGDMAMLSGRLDNKPLSARLLVCEGKQAGDRTALESVSPHLCDTAIQPI